MKKITSLGLVISAFAFANSASAVCETERAAVVTAREAYKTCLTNIITDLQSVLATCNGTALDSICTAQVTSTNFCPGKVTKLDAAKKALKKCIKDSGGSTSGITI